MHTVLALFCYVVVTEWLILPVSFQVASMPAEQSYNCPAANETILQIGAISL